MWKNLMAQNAFKSFIWVKPWQIFVLQEVLLNECATTPQHS
jgi:hypothetical protein